MRGKSVFVGLRALATFAVILSMTNVWAHVHWNEKVLHSFNNDGSDGQFPLCTLVIDVAGNLYGTTERGGTYDHGMVFELSPAPGGGWTETVLHSFNGTDGGVPTAGLTFDAAGNLYGTTLYSDVFELSPNEGGGWTYTVLHEFGGGDGGYNPGGSLIFDAAGNLYGTTGHGGLYCSTLGGCGTVFELSPAGGGTWTEKVLHNFDNDGMDGTVPEAGLIFDGAGNLYGTTLAGGVYDNGIVFELTSTEGGNWTETVLYSFGPVPDGEKPYSGLTFDAAGNLYGTTNLGGTNNEGALFELSPSGSGSWTETVVHSFGNGTDGARPYLGSLIFDTAGNLYGMTAYGGDADGGTVFELSPNGNGGWTEMVLYSFDRFVNPMAGVTFDAVGNLYGTTQFGGTYGYGTVFELSPIYPCIRCNGAGLR